MQVETEQVVELRAGYKVQYFLGWRFEMDALRTATILEILPEAERCGLPSMRLSTGDVLLDGMSMQVVEPFVTKRSWYVRHDHCVCTHTVRCTLFVHVCCSLPPYTQET